MKANKRYKIVIFFILGAIWMQMTGIGAGAPHTAAAAAGTVYYVDSAGGSDGNSGTSVDQPWRTLGHVSAMGWGFHAGDQILLKSGSIWNEYFDVTFSGSAEGQITIGTYGGNVKPIVNGGGHSFAIRIDNQQYVTLQGIEITNYNAANVDDYKTQFFRRSGIWLTSHHQGPMNNIQLKNLDIHDVTGISVSGEDWVTSTDGEQVNKNSNAAIMVSAWEWESNVATDKHAYFNHLLIDNNNIHDIRTIGISVDGYQTDLNLFHKDVVVRNNTINKTGSDGIIIGASENPLIENNAAYDVGINSYDFKWIAGIWVWKTNGATFRHNEVARVHYLNVASTDSSAFDTDIMAQGDHLYEYNYSHDNSGGFVMDMGQLQNGKNIYRYNVSRNDRRFRPSANTVNVQDNGIFYNNVFYNDNGEGFVIQDNPKSTYINNIFYTSKGSLPYPKGPAFYNNDFFGSAPPSQGIRNLTVDPKFASPGSGGDGMDKVNSFKLQSDSPLIGEGRVIEDNGSKDFWGNPLYTGSPDIGLFEDPASTKQDTTAPIKPSALRVNEKTDTTVTLAWTSEENAAPLDADIYDSATNERIASVIMGNTVTLKGLLADTSYSFYIVARDLSGNRSQASEPISVTTTKAAIIVDDTEAIKIGSWAQATGSASYQGSYSFTPKGNGSKSIQWTPDLPEDGYYAVYYWLPQRNWNESRATNASFNIHFDGGSKSYIVNEYTTSQGEWVLLGNHKFKAGTSGSVILNDFADDKVVADAVRFQYLADFGLEHIAKVTLAAQKQQIKIGQSTELSIVGTDNSGKILDLKTEGAVIQYHSDNAAATVSVDGSVTGVSSGTVHISATVRINGQDFTTNTVSIIVGNTLTVTTPVFTDSNDSPLGSIQPNQTVKAATTVVNSTDSDQNVTLILGVYGKDGLLQSAVQSIIVKSFNSQSLTASLVMPELIEGTSIRAFVWDGKGSMHPLAAKTIFSN